MNTIAFAPTFLLPVDGSAHAEGAARHLARRAALLPGSHVVVLHVENHHTPAGQLRMPAEQAVRSATALLKQAGVRAEVRFLVGEAAETILRCAKDLAAGEIVMGSRGLGRWSGLVIGSVAMKIVQHAPMPVTVVATFAGSDGALNASVGDHLLLATDGSRPSIRATEYICALHAARLPLQVELTTVVGPIPPAWLQENITPEKLQYYYRQEGDRLLFESRTLLENAGVLVHKRIETGFVADKLIQVAAATGCTRMVLGCRGRTGLSGLLLGSVAYQAMHLSLIPVTLVK